jgi:hypothetical protein
VGYEDGNHDEFGAGTTTDDDRPAWLGETIAHSTNMPRMIWFFVVAVICCVNWWLPFVSVSSSHRPSTLLRQLQLALTASTQFQIVLSPTKNELQFEALKVIELVLSSVILDEQSYQTSLLAQNELTVEQALTSREEITDLEIVIQESNFQMGLSTTRIKFFALATFVVINDTASSDTNEYRQTYLNDLIEQSFSADTKTSQFLSNLRTTASSSGYSAATALQLQDVDTLVIAPVTPAMEPSSSTNDNTMDGEMNDKNSSSALSVLDKIIIAISCGICGGLFVLFIWHVRDVCHYIASTRHQLFLQNDNTMGSFPQFPRYDDYSKSDGESANTSSPHFVTTSFMSEENPDVTALVSGTLSTPKRSFSMATSLTDFPILAMDGPEFESHEELSTASFETNLFRSNTKIVPLGIRGNDTTDHELSSDGSQVKDETEEVRSPPPMDDSSRTSVRSSDDRIGAVPVSYFVPIDPEDGTAEEESVQMSSDDNRQVDDGEDDFSLPRFTEVDVLSIGHLSLEQSMASSTPPTL